MSKFQFVNTVNNRVSVYGKTFDVKEKLKEVGGLWDSKSKCWNIPIASATLTFHQSLDAFLDEQKAKEKADEKAARAYALTPEGRAEAEVKRKQTILDCLEEKKKTGAYHWICCQSCVVVDWKRQHTTCDACAVDYGIYKNSFRVRGMIYTGD
jgi:hypothetical protein